MVDGRCGLGDCDVSFRQSFGKICVFRSAMGDGNEEPTPDLMKSVIGETNRKQTMLWINGCVGC